MKLDYFLEKNKILLSRETKKLCNKGLFIMKQSKDQIHGIDHIYSILDNLDYLINKHKERKSIINFNTLLLSICWHDVWISTKKSNNILKILYFQLVEGVKSANLFYKEAVSTKLDDNLRKHVYYTIRKHSSFQILPTFFIEAQILFDLDKIEMWNNRRFFQNKNRLPMNVDFFDKYLVRFYYTYSQKMGLYFQDLERVFRGRLKTFRKELENIKKESRLKFNEMSKTTKV